MPPIDGHRVTVGLHLAAPGLGDVVCDVRCKRRFTHARPAGEDDQVGLLQPAHHAIEIVQSGGDARQLSVTLESVRGHIDRGRECLREALETAVVAAGLRQFV